MRGRDQGRGPGRFDSEDVIRASSEYFGHGLTFAVSALLFFLAGYWVDGKLQTTPLFAILGGLLGGLAGFYRMYRSLTGARERDRPGGEEP